MRIGERRASGHEAVDVRCFRLRMSTELAGEYAPALQLVTPLSIIAGALTLVLFPSMAEAQGAGDLDRLRRTCLLYTSRCV